LDNRGGRRHFEFQAIALPHRTEGDARERGRENLPRSVGIGEEGASHVLEVGPNALGRGGRGCWVLRSNKGVSALAQLAELCLFRPESSEEGIDVAVFREEVGQAIDSGGEATQLLVQFGTWGRGCEAGCRCCPFSAKGVLELWPVLIHGHPDGVRDGNDELLLADGERVGADCLTACHVGRAPKVAVDAAPFSLLS
jgi:hypothetical protein